MRGLVEKDMQAVINTYDLKPYYYPTLFPLKQTYTLTWKALEAQVGLKIAADLVARGASIDKKTRDPLQLRIKVAFIWANVDISDFKAGGITDATFTFPRSQYKDYEFIDKRKD